MLQYAHSDFIEIDRTFITHIYIIVIMTLCRKCQSKANTTPMLPVPIIMNHSPFPSHPPSE